MLKKAFTLIELLVVIAIIAILAAMLMPSLGRAQESTKYTTCLTGMKQEGLGVAWYANDWGDWLPINTSFGNMNSNTSDGPTAEAFWYAYPTRQGPFFGIKPPSAGPGCWPPWSVQQGHMSAMGDWPNKIFKYCPVQEVASCPNRGGWKTCDALQGAYVLMLTPWGVPNAIGAVEWHHGYNESMAHSYWKDGPWGGGNGRYGDSCGQSGRASINNSEMTHAGDTIFAGHVVTSTRWSPHFCGQYPIYIHPYHGATNKHFRETGEIISLVPPEWPVQYQGRENMIVGKSPYLMADSSVRGFEYKPMCWDATRLFLGPRAADDLDHAWPP
jgi:prepilin-type N-terminal cleavage/methylation domain-containing protein